MMLLDLSRVDLAALIGRDTTLKKSGYAAAGPCPWCGGDDRFTVYPVRGRYNRGHYECRQCGREGDALDYLQEYHGMSFRVACEYLGLDREDDTAAGRAWASVALVEPRPEPPAWADQIPALIGNFEWQLWNLPRGERARRWLHARGLADETIRAWRLGLNSRPDSHWPDLKHQNSRGAWVPQGVTIPLLGADGRYYGINVRRPVCQSGTKNRYLTVTGTTRPLIVVDRGSDECVFCEGELDAALASQVVRDLDVATLGSCRARPDAWIGHLRTYRRIWQCYDIDDPGQAGYELFWAGMPNVRRVLLPMDPAAEGKDVGDFISKAGGDLRALIASHQALDALRSQAAAWLRKEHGPNQTSADRASAQRAAPADRPSGSGHGGEDDGASQRARETS